jgi:glycogen debranching enzyme
MEEAKEERYRTMLARSALDIPDASIMRAWDWIKCDYDWLVRSVEPWGSGLGAGAPEYVWWFGCDNGYALRGCLALGQHDIAVDTLDLLRRVSEGANGSSGRVIHEANTRGVATDLGRTEETPHFVRAVWDTFLWTGDIPFVERTYDFCKRGLLGWTLGEHAKDGDPAPYGYGVMEMAGLDLQCVDTASLTVEALDGLAGMADLVGDTETAARCRAIAAATRSRLADFWIDAEGLYGDMLATPDEMVPRLRVWKEEASSRNPEAARAYAQLLAEAEGAPDRQRKRPWLLKNWSVLSPVEAGLATDEQALRTLQRAEGPEFTGPWGVYISGIEGNAMMSIGTGVLAVAETMYGRAEQALAYVRVLTDTLEMQMPGAIAEMSPDYGCFVQAWSGYGVAWPVVTGIFGIRPDAAHRTVELAPNFPPGWRDARLTNIHIGTNTIDLHWDGETLWVASRERGWQVTCDSLPLRLASRPAPHASILEPQ